jgi:hypothetical protein
MVVGAFRKAPHYRGIYSHRTALLLRALREGRGSG